MLEKPVMLAELRAAAVAFDETKLTAIVDCCCEMFPLKWVCTDLIIPVMSLLELEEQGMPHKRIVSFAEEAILLCLRKRATFIDQYVKQRPYAPIIISGSVPHQDDELYGYMVSLLLAVEGYKIVHIQGHSSLESLLSAVDIHNVSAIVLHTKTPNRKSSNVIYELLGHFSSAEYLHSCIYHHKSVRKPQLFLSGQYDYEIPGTVQMTFEEVVSNDVGRRLFGKQIVRAKNEMMIITHSLISASCAKMRQAYTRLGVREEALDDVNMCPRNRDVL
jgi:hypothetical protein